MEPELAMLFSQCQKDGGIYRRDSFEGERLEQAGGEVLVPELPGKVQRWRQKRLLVPFPNTVGPESQQGRCIVGPCSTPVGAIGGPEQFVERSEWVALGPHRE